MPKKHKDFTREELMDLRDRAILLSQENISGSWKRKYLALADAADSLDAFNARSTILACAVCGEDGPDLI